MRGLSITGIVLGLCVLAGLAGFFGAFYTIDAGEKGVILRNGAITGTAGPGFHWKIPFIDDVVEVSTRTFTLPYEKEPFYSKDQQAATADVSITFAAQPDAVSRIYEQYGSLDAVAQRIITPRVKKEFKEVMGQFNAATAIQERERMGIEVAKAIIGDGNNVILIESVQVENIDFSDAYEGAIETRMLAEVSIQTESQNVEKERKLAEIKVVQAQAVADAALAQKTADAEGIRLVGEAEASAINAKGRALKDNPGLTELIAVERWQGVLPTTMVPGGAVPFINVNPANPLD